MFKFKDISDDEKFRSQEYFLTSKEFFEKRRTSNRPYVFDLRKSEAFEEENIPGSHNIPMEHFESSIYQMPFQGDIFLYGSNDGEAVTASEILFDNGFDTFKYTDSFSDLVKDIDNSFLEITGDALNYLKEHLNTSNKKNVLKILIEPTSPLKANYKHSFVNFQKEGNICLDFDPIKVCIERKNFSYIEGTIIEINEEGNLEVRNPNLSISKLSGPLEEQIQTLLDEQVNPMLASHGGNVMLEGIKDNSAYLRFGGGCQGCSMIDTTVKQGVEVMLKESIPGLNGVFDITDHSEGESPFYKE